MASEIEILQVAGALVAVLTLSILIIIFFRSMQGKNRQPRPELSTESFFGNMQDISSDAAYYYDGLFTKGIEILFRRRSNGAEALAFADCRLTCFAKLNRYLVDKDVSGVMSIALSGKEGNILAGIHNGEIKVKLNGAEIGRISLTGGRIKDAEGLSAGEFGKHGMGITGRDVLGIPFIGRRGNFHVKQPVEMHGREAGTINFRKWPDHGQPLIENVDRKLRREDAALLFTLAAFEWALSVNLRTSD